MQKKTNKQKNLSVPSEVGTLSCLLSYIAPLVTGFNKSKEVQGEEDDSVP